jgi:hypothetical protein
MTADVFSRDWVGRFRTAIFDDSGFNLLTWGQSHRAVRNGVLQQ